MTDPINGPRSPATPALGTPDEVQHAPHGRPATASNRPTTPARAQDQFGTNPPSDRRIDRALGTSAVTRRAPTNIETRLSLNLALARREADNAATLLRHMETAPRGPSYEAHRHDVPFAPPLEDALRDMRSEVLGHGSHVGAEQVVEQVVHHGVEHGAEWAAEHGAPAAGGVLGTVGSVMPIVGIAVTVIQFQGRTFRMGDEGFEAAQRRQAWEDHQGLVDGRIAQSRADGRHAAHAADLVNTSEPVTIDWDRFANDGDYAEGAMQEARARHNTATNRAAGYSQRLEVARNMLPIYQDITPWLTEGLVY